MNNFTMYNTSSRITDDQCRTMVTACNFLLNIFCKIWYIAPSTVTFARSIATRELNEILARSSNISIIVMADNTDVKGALAYHTEVNAIPICYIFAETELKNGATIFYKDDHTPTIAQSLSHEVFETLLDPYVNYWATSFEQNIDYAREACDAVQDGIIKVKVNDTVVGLSNFLLPAWFDEQRQGPYDYLRVLTRPFSITRGGYSVIKSSRGIQTIFGEMVPGWIREKKKSAIRCNRRRVQQYGDDSSCSNESSSTDDKSKTSSP